MQIEEADLIQLSSQYNDYLADDEGKTTSAIQLQDDAYALGYKRAELATTNAKSLLAKIMQAHVSALPKATRTEIEAVIG
ncbi:MAG: hypothetical protein K2X80_02770 [Pseudomonadaceae bacterium]|nr:hypothetical protein [Pseudomonadaceae bacterium]